MARIIVDGYNVIGTAHGDMEKARRELLDLLIRYRGVSQHDVTAVFDGYHRGSGIETVTVTGGVRVIYSRIRERADDVIKRIVSEGGGEWVVVSSDREIAGHAWSHGSVSVTSEAFLDIVKGRLRESGAGSGPGAPWPPPGDRTIDEEDKQAEDTLRRGNPHRLSKKQRALARVLGKL